MGDLKELKTKLKELEFNKTQIIDVDVLESFYKTGISDSALFCSKLKSLNIDEYRKHEDMFQNLGITIDSRKEYVIDKPHLNLKELELKYLNEYTNSKLNTDTKTISEEIDLSYLIPNKHVSKEDLKLIDRIYSGSDPDEEIVERFNASITRHCFKTLSLSKWVNDEIINCYANLCWKRNSVSVQKQSYLFSSFFLTTLVSVKDGYKFSNVSRWTKKFKIDLFNKRLIFFPININNLHWILICVDIMFKQVFVLDSLHSRQADRMNYIWNYLKDEYLNLNKSDIPDQDKWEFLDGNDTSTNVPRQANSDDCGVFVCMFINLLMAFIQKSAGSNNKLNLKQIFSSLKAVDMPRIRQQIQLDILKSSVFPFDKVIPSDKV